MNDHDLPPSPPSPAPAPTRPRPGWRLFSWKNARRLLLGAAISGTLTALFYAEENWRGGRAWAAFRREAAAAGVELELAKLAPPPVPDSQNIAKFPLFDHPFPGYKNGANGGQNADDPWESLTKHFIPQRPDGFPSTTILATLWQTSQPDWQKERQTALDNWQQQHNFDLAAHLAAHAPELDEIARALEERPQAVWPINYDPPHEITLPHLPILRHLASHYAWRSIHALDAGDTAAATRNLRSIFRIIQLEQNQNFLISSLTQQAVTTIALSLILEGNARGQWTAEDHATIDAELAQINLIAVMRRAMSTQCGGTAVGIARTASQPHTLTTMFYPENNYELRRSLWLLQYGPRGWILQTAALSGHQMLTRHLPAFDAQHQRVNFALVRDIDSRARDTKDTLKPWAVVAYGGIVPTGAGLLRITAQNQSGVILARAACRVEQHRLRTGHYPATLAALAPDLATDTLHDVVTGEPIHYRPPEGEQSYVLYVTGEDGVDNGGILLPPDAPRKSRRREPQDWVWSAGPKSAGPVAPPDPWPLAP
ncbi:MAG: hypothetical protein LBK99_20750 [Opitutaceae bacterium]|jgi:hypothetical protein|nr:hypothetical protein [Opitutaceae bacterium]